MTRLTAESTGAISAHLRYGTFHHLCCVVLKAALCEIVYVLMCVLQLLRLLLFTAVLGMNVARKVVILALVCGLQTTWTCPLQNHRSQLLLWQHVQS